MSGLRVLLLVVVLVVGGAIWAESPVAVTEAQEVSAHSPESAAVPPEAVSTLPEDLPMTPDQSQQINQKIDINLIDLNLLREIVEGQAGAERLRMSLQECISLAIECNPDLQVVRFEPLKADADILASKGEFDPALSGQALYLRSTQEASPEYRTFGGIDTIDVYRTTSKTSVSGKLSWGMMYDATFELDKDETTYNRFFSEWSGGLTLTLSQPLLKGRGEAANLARIRIAKNTRQASDAQVRLAVMNTVAQVVKSYWDLVGAIESVSVREQALANADRLLDISKKRLEIGTAAAIEVLQAKAGVASRQTDLISARSQVANSEDALKQILNMRDNGIFSAKRIDPIDRPDVAEFNAEDLKNTEQQLEKSIELALNNRPETVMSQLEIDSAKLDRTRAANQMLPTVDVTGSVFQGGRNHYMREVFNGVVDRNDNAYTVGIKGSVPIGNRTARGAFQRAEITTRQAEQKLDKTKQQLMLNVRLATRALYTSQILVESNRQARTLQETNVAAEEKRLRLGVSTSYRVLQIQADLTTAQTQEVQARIAFEKALVDLRLAEGTLLDSLGIEFTAPEPEPPVKFVRSIVPPAPK